MHAALLLMIVAINPDAPIADRPAGAVEIFHCDFAPPWDKNFDDLPDRWVRRRGPGFPHYVAMGIRPDPAAAVGHCLEIRLDGGAGLCVHLVQTWAEALGEPDMKGRHVRKTRVCVDRPASRQRRWSSDRIARLDAGHLRGDQGFLQRVLTVVIRLDESPD